MLITFQNLDYSRKGLEEEFMTVDDLTTWLYDEHGNTMYNSYQSIKELEKAITREIEETGTLDDGDDLLIDPIYQREIDYYLKRLDISHLSTKSDQGRDLTSEVKILFENIILGAMDDVKGDVINIDELPDVTNASLEDVDNFLQDIEINTKYGEDLLKRRVRGSIEENINFKFLTVDFAEKA